MIFSDFAIKNVKVVKALSDETECFTATLYYKGKKVGQASNRGHGGCNEYFFNRDTDLGREAQELAYKSDENGADLDSHIGDLLFEAQLMKDAKRYQRQGFKLVIAVSEPSDDEWGGRQWSILAANGFTPEELRKESDFSDEAEVKILIEV